MTKLSPPDTIRTSRAVYDPAIRETIIAGDIDQMKQVLTDAKAVHKEQGNLKGAITRLEAAIRAAS